MAEAVRYAERLEEIAHTSFGALSDDEVLRLLAERKQLETLKEQYEAVQKEQAQRAAVDAERSTILGELDRLNALISPDKPDDELIHLIEERKTWEAKLAQADEALAALGASGEVSPQQEAKVLPEEKAEVIKPAAPATGTESEKVDADFGDYKIQELHFDRQSLLGKTLDQMESDPDAMGKILDELEASAKKNKEFMLAVAEIDPAYAMHYADKDTLKKDEDFNVKVVSMKGKRSTGNVLAEMLPEARTDAVMVAAVKRDYRNVRYVLPQMASYDKMLERAKKATLEKVKELKNGVDIADLVPKILQKDKVFMEQVTALVPKGE